LKEDCGSSNVLACLSEEWRMIAAVVITDAAVDIVSPVSSCATIIAAPELLLERCTQLHQLLSLFLEIPF
jgi:hypothetical protein